MINFKEILDIKIVKKPEEKESKELASKVLDLFDLRYDIGRQILDRITYRNILYYIGEQWMDFYPNAGTFKRKKLPSFIPTPVHNKVKDFVRSWKAMHLNQKLIPKVSPSTEEAEDRRSAQIASKVLGWMDTINDGEIENEKEIMVIWLALAGVGFLRTYNDRGLGKWFMGKDGLEKTGEVVTRTLIPFSVRMDYFGQSLQQKRWIGIQTLVAKEYAEDMFKTKIDSSDQEGRVIDYEKKLMDLVSQVSPWKGAGMESQISSSRADDKEYVLLREMEIAPTKQFPKGRYLIACADKIILDTDRLPIPSSEDSWYYTITDFHGDYVPGRYWSDAPTNDIISPQNTINEINQLLAINRKGLGRTRVLTPADISLTRLNQGSHGFLVLKYDAFSSGGAKPEFQIGIPLPEQIVEEKRDAEAAIQDVTGDPKNILQGAAPSAGSSGIQIDILRETAERSHYPDLARFNRAMGKVYKKRLILAGEVYTEKRKAKIVGRGRRMEIIDFKGADLRKNTDVVLELDSGISTTRAGQTQLIMQLTKMNMFGDYSQNPELQEEILDRLGLSGIPTIANEDIQRAEAENADIAKGTKRPLMLIDSNQRDPQTGSPFIVSPDPIFVLDNHGLHFTIHRRFILGAEFTALDQNKQTTLIIHTQGHQFALMEQMQAMQPPPQQPGNGKEAGVGGGEEPPGFGEGENIRPFEPTESQFAEQGMGAGR